MVRIGNKYPSWREPYEKRNIYEKNRRRRLCRATAATFTNNRVKAAPLYVCMEHLENGIAQAIVANSGNANACAPSGMDNARRMAAAAAKAVGIEENLVLVGSTGVIGQRINIETIEAHMDALAAKLSTDGSAAANNAILTTDLVEKTVALEFTCGGKTCHIGGIAKGSGMIHPNMGTMLCFITTDCAVDPSILRTALQDAVAHTFNRISVDVFYDALYEVALTLAKKMAADGEGASKLICCTVKNSRAEEYAERLAKAVIASSLVKAAMFGADANWGRILCAMGYSKAPFRPEYVTIGFSSAAGSITVCQNGRALDFDEDLAKKILLEKEVSIDVDIQEGDAEATAYGCDLTYDYVRINGDYRT